MKVSVSLPADDVKFLDRYRGSAGTRSRSAVIQQAIRLLRHADLENDYAAAWTEWESSEDSKLLDQTSADGI
jgi:Arc/MetJ-type ribon-helix-helix transcriptional regulator